MKMARWGMASQVETFFHEVVDLAPGEASRVLNERCAGAPRRRRAVEELLRRERELPPSFLEPDARLVAGVVDAADRALRDLRAGAEPLAGNERAGHFVVIERIGEGAAGGVYLARDEALDRRVVLKVMHQPADLPCGATREARALARLSHVNVVRLYEVGEYQGRPFMAMEWIPGCNLQAWLADEPRTMTEILGVFMQAGRGLSAAHQEGLVHCDFKPENVLVGVDGRVCVADFGVAAMTLGDVSPRHGMGTPAFMAPEQFMGDEVTPATDQFAYCVALYSALFGVAPFDGADALSLRAAVLSGALRMRARGDAVPVRLARILERGLERDPAARFPSMSALLTALEEFLPRRVAQEPAPARRARTLVCGIMVLLGGVALAFHGSGARWLVPETTRLLVMPSLALFIHAVAAATLRQTLLGNPYSRKVVAMIWLGGITVIFHRIVAFRFGQPVPEVIAVDLLMLALEQLAAALLLAPSFGFAALLFLCGAVVALLVPSHAVNALLGSVIAAYMLPIVSPARERRPAHAAPQRAFAGQPTSRSAFRLSDRVSAS